MLLPTEGPSSVRSRQHRFLLPLRRKDVRMVIPPVRVINDDIGGNFLDETAQVRFVLRPQGIGIIQLQILQELDPGGLVTVDDQYLCALHPIFLRVTRFGEVPWRALDTKDPILPTNTNKL